jgi:muconolactone delta-isomerase
MPTENKTETKRILSIAGSIKRLVEKEQKYNHLSLSDILTIVEYADTLAALVLHKDTEIRVTEN